MRKRQIVWTITYLAVIFGLMTTIAFGFLVVADDRTAAAPTLAFLGLTALTVLVREVARKLPEP